MANTFKFGNGNWAVKDGYALAYNDENNNFKPLPFDFTRASTATRVNKQGLVETVGSGKPRIDFLDNTSGHLLLEPSRTNKMPTSEDFNSADWNRSILTITSDDAISPYGTSTADKIAFTGGGSLRTENTFTFTDAYTYSIFVKKGNSRYVTLRSFAFTTSAIIGFDLDSVTAQTGGVIEQYPNDWFRLSISKDVSSDADKNGYFYFYLPNSLGSTTSVSGNYAYIFGNQIEEGSYATSYIPTEGSSVTRVAENAFQENVTQVIGQSEGTMYIEFVPKDISAFQILYQVRSNSGTIGQIDIRLTGGNIITLANDGGSNQFSMGSTSYSAGTTYKVAVRYKLNDSKIYINGSSVGSDTSCSFTSSSLDQVSFAENLYSFLPIVDILDARLYDTGLTDTELQNLTS